MEVALNKANQGANPKCQVEKIHKDTPFEFG